LLSFIIIIAVYRIIFQIFLIEYFYNKFRLNLYGFNEMLYQKTFMIIVCGVILGLLYATQFPSFEIYAHQANCDSSYPDVCIPPYPPDLNCGDISDKRFGVMSPDPHGFDGGGDGVGCES
jgi:hypothetical protein